MGKVLSDDQIAQYERDGFLFPVSVLTPDEAAAAHAALEQAEADHPGTLDGAGRNNPHLMFPFLDAIVHHPRMLDAVEDIIGPDIRVWGTVLFIKEAHDPGYVSWHQDFTHMGLEPHLGISAWLALTPSTIESGCMRMIPGTHKSEILPHHDTFDENNILTRGQTIHGVDESKAVDLVLQPGEMSLHTPRTIHASAPNNSDNRRIGFTIQSYLPPEVRQTKGEGYAQHARGVDPFGHLKSAPRPKTLFDPEAMVVRERINALWAEQLYDGAEMKRDL